MRVLKRPFSSIVFLAAIGILGTFPASSLASENEGSLDSVWNESENRAQKEGADNAASNSKSASASSHLHAICPLASFLNGDMVQTGAWPGVGPFKADASRAGDYIDSAENRLSMTLKGDEITAAQLDLQGGSNASETLVKLEVASDFLLEGLNAKPAKIQDFNVHLEKEAAHLKGKGASSPLIVMAHPLVVSLQAVPAPGSARGKQAGAKENYRVRVVRSNAVPEDEASLSSKEKSGRRYHGEVETAASAARPAGGTAYDTDKTTIAAVGKTGTQSPVASNEELKHEFLQLIQSWQTVKKTALRQRDSKALSEVLAGRALSQQSNAIKWLLEHHRYYEMSLKSLNVDRVSEVVPGEKYSIFAQIKESTKLMDDSTVPQQVLKESSDAYKVNYTVEKIDGRWLITDSALANASNLPSAPKAHR
jgi:hypothetical protein